MADAAETVIASDFTKGLEYFDAVRAKYRDEPWYKDLHGNFTFRVLPYTGAELREKGQNSGSVAQLLYDPMRTLRALDVPQLWILGEDDILAPSAATSRRLKSLIADGKPITIALAYLLKTLVYRKRPSGFWARDQQAQARRIALNKTVMTPSTQTPGH